MNTNNSFIELSNQASVLLINLKEIIDKLQSEKSYFKNQVVKLKNKNKQLVISNKNLTHKVDMLQKHLQRKISL